MCIMFRFGKQIFNGFGRKTTASLAAQRTMASSAGKPGPYSLPKGEAYPSEAYPFGLGPGSKPEGWEAITYICYFGCTLWLVVGLSLKEDDSFKAWARREALAREVAVENGEEIEFGKYYSAGSRGFEEDEMDTMPVVKSGGD